MKIKTTTFCALIVAIAAICFGVYYAKVAYRAYVAYEKVRQADDEVREMIRLSKMSNSDLDNLNAIIKNWELIREGPVDEELKSALRSAGYSANINGVVDLFSIPMPAFSFYNSGRNSLWAVRSSLRGIFPIRGNALYYSERLFYGVDTKNGYAIVYEMRDAELYYSLYQHKPR